MQRLLAGAEKRNIMKNWQQLAADNHNLIYACLVKMGVSIEEWYGTAAIAFCDAAKRYEPDTAEFSTVAYVFIKNAVLKEMKAQGRQFRKLDQIAVSYDVPCTYNNKESSSSESILDGVPSDAPSVEKMVIDQVSAESFWDSLDDTQKELVNYRLQGLTYREIAKKIGVKQQRIGQRMKVIQKKLKAHMEM